MSGGIQSIPLVQTPDRQVNQLQQNIVQTVNQILKCPIISGAQIIAKQSLKAGDNTIAHGLSRTLQGWLVVRYRGGWAEIFDKQDTNGNRGSTLILNASADVVVDLYVF